MPSPDQNTTPLFDAVKKYINENYVRFHVPGHKAGRGNPELRDYLGEQTFKMDVCVMHDLDYLNNPSGVILEAENLLADAFNADKAYFLVNGTTSGVQAMIMSTCGPGDKIIVPRNAHKSVIGGIILSNAIPVYIQPEINEKLGIAMGVSVESIKKAIEENKDAKAVFIINPTYYGAVSDLKSIVRIAHSHGMAVLVDEAHGAHMGFHEGFPLTAMECGADMSAASLHKTGGSFTQSSILLQRGNRVSPPNLKQILNLTSSTSPSYLLMASLDTARKQLAVQGREMLGSTLEIARWARKEINSINGLYAFGKDLVGSPGCFDFDETKLGIYFGETGYTGYQMESLLREKYKIQVEMSDLYNILCILTIGDRREDLEALINALKNTAPYGEPKWLKNLTQIIYNPRMVVTPRDAFYASKRTIPIEESPGHISGEMIMAYPPGIPIICMGEEITREMIEYLQMLKREKCELQGTSDADSGLINILEGC